jgi:hypothetical protein
MSTFTPNLNLELPANGADPNTWDVPVNGDFTIIDTAIGGNTVLNVVSQTGIIPLTLAQYRNRILIFSGVLSANVSYQIPTGVGGFWYIVNLTTGAFTLTISSGGGGLSALCAQGANTIVLSDGVNIRPAQNAIAAAAGSNTQVQFNSSGSLGAAAALTFDSGTNTLASTNFSGNLAGTVTAAVTVGASGPLIGYRNIPPSANTTPAVGDVGKYLPVNSGFTMPPNVFSDGDAFLIVNTAGSSITLTQGAGVTFFKAGTGTSGNVILSNTGSASFLCRGGNTFLVSGPGVS